MVALFIENPALLGFYRYSLSAKAYQADTLQKHFISLYRFTLKASKRQIDRMHPNHFPRVLVSSLLWLCVESLFTCPFAVAQEEAELPAELGALPESIQDAGKALDPVALVIKETYGDGGSGVNKSEIFTTAGNTGIGIVGNELVIDQEADPAGTIQLLVKDFPATIDLKMRMEISDDGYVGFTAYCPIQSLGGQMRSGQVIFHKNRVSNAPTKSSLPVNNLGEALTYRLVFDAEGKGRLYFLDGSGKSIPIGAQEATGDYRSLDLGIYRAKIYIEEAAVYQQTP